MKNETDLIFNIVVEMSPHVYEMIESIRHRSGEDFLGVFKNAIALLWEAHEAKRQGKAVGYAETADWLECEFVGF